MSLKNNNELKSINKNIKLYKLINSLNNEDYTILIDILSNTNKKSLSLILKSINTNKNYNKNKYNKGNTDNYNTCCNNNSISYDDNVQENIQKLHKDYKHMNENETNLTKQMYKFHNISFCEFS
jgi:hypothetical protein